MRNTNEHKLWTTTYLNCGERYEDMIDHHSYTHNLKSCEIKAWKKFRPDIIYCLCCLISSFFLLKGLAKRVHARLLLASTSEVYGGQ